MANSKTYYFGYGSNLWRNQMEIRCPESKFLGIAYLEDWRWIINTRGYANVVPSKGDEVYAFLYELSASDEEALDHYEGVPDSYVKQTLQVVFFGKKTGPGERPHAGVFLDALVYVDIERVQEGPPKREYIYRMNSAIADALAEGVSQAYIEKYLRPRIPVETSSTPEMLDPAELSDRLNKV